MTRVLVVGLGPAGADLLVPRARAALEQIPTRYVRTKRHRAVDDLAREGITFEAFDPVYEAAETIDEVYRRIVDALLAAANERGAVVYAVPGNPGVAERTVALLGARAAAGACTVETIPGVSFADLAWSRVGVDPLDGSRVLDAHALDPTALEAGGPVLIAQVDRALVASDVKLALLDRLAHDAPVTVLQRLGLPDEHVVTVPVHELDRAVELDHLTTVYVELPPGAADTFGALVALARRLRGPGGCPWDAEQTHRTLTRYLLEEAYEVVDAIEALPTDADAGTDVVDAGPIDAAASAALADELGDLLFQVVFHGILAEEDGDFTTADVAQGIHDKLVRRHPHVFGEVEVANASDVVRNWEQIKKGERGSDSLVDSVSPGLPALLYTHKLFRKASSVGLEPGDRARAAAVLTRAATAAATDDAIDREWLVGEVLAAAVLLARDAGTDAESALRRWAGQYRAHFQRMEAAAQASGVDLHGLTSSEVAALWDQTEGDGG